MRPTRPPDGRRSRHEATGEWPQPSLWSMLEARAARTPERVYLIEGRPGGRQYTFADLHARATRIAAALHRLGVGLGDVVSWQLPNWLEGVALAAAVDRLGAISNPIITIYREQEITFVCRQAGSRVLVVPGVVRGTDHREIAAAVRAASPDLEHVLTVRAEPAGGMQALEALEAAAVPPPSPRGPDDVSMLFYTSGTTAEPKGVLHTPSTLGAVNHFHAKLFPPSADDRTLLQFPLTHIGGMVLFVMHQLRCGSSAVFMDTYDPELAVELIAEHGVTAAGGPPAVLHGMLGARGFSAEKVRTVRLTGSGAADVSPELMRTAKERFGSLAYRSYGMTECPILSCGAPGDPEEKLHGTDGRPSPGCTARLVDDAGRPVAPGVEGEIEAYGPQLCVGYLDAALNVAFTADGFFRTGDLGVLDDGGFLRITGRRKDIIIRKGENLSAKGIEDVLAEHPKVADVAVIGLPDERSGELVCAVVSTTPGSEPLSFDEMQAHLRERGLRRQAIPERLEHVDVVPRNPSGKITKQVLRETFGAA